MRGNGIVVWIFPGALAIFAPLCAPVKAVERPAPPVPISALWEQPADLHARNLLHGEWGIANAPDPQVVYTFVRFKEGGVNPGLIVRDCDDREWSVKQAIHSDQGDEGPVEVVLSRILAAVGYRQPPVYYLPRFALRDSFGARIVGGGRFRLRDDNIKERGDWAWDRNPFVGTRPLAGLLTILLMFQSSDLKSANNSIYEIRRGDLVEPWYVVRDLGAALGETGRFAPFRNNVEIFERQRFILAIDRGFVSFAYGGFHRQLVSNRITPDDVRWAAGLLDRLTAVQWSDAFRAGGYDPDTADRFIRRLRATIDEGLTVERR
jgi:hypothetical protein